MEQRKQDTTGTRFNPREQWVEVRNAHPAIITPEELELALFKKAKARNNSTAGRTNDSPYLFTGKNLEGQSMFICTSCGGSVIGYRSSSKHWRKYVCGPSRYKGDAGCPDKFMVDQDWLEDTLLSEIEKRYSAPDRINEIICQVKDEIHTGFKSYHSSIEELTKHKDKLALELKRLLNAVKSGFNPSAIAKESNNIQEQIDQIDIKLNHFKNNPPSQLAIDDEEIRKFFTDFIPTFKQATIAERKKLIRTFIRKLELDPKKQEVRVYFYPDHLVHSIGVGGGT